MSDLKTIEGIISDLLSASEARKADLQGKIESAEESEQKAIVKAAEAYKTGDVKTYHKAQDEVRTAQDSQKMFADMLSRENDSPLLSDEDYQKYITEVMCALAEATKNAKAETAGLLDQIIAISQKNAETIEDGNKILYSLQHEVMKDDASVTTQAGKRVWMVHLEKKYEDYTIAQIQRLLPNDFYYQKIKGLR